MKGGDAAGKCRNRTKRAGRKGPAIILPPARGTKERAPQNGGWPEKKDSGGRKAMLEFLKEILGDGYTAEIDQKDCAERCKRAELPDGRICSHQQ